MSDRLFVMSETYKQTVAVTHENINDSNTFSVTKERRKWTKREVRSAGKWN